MSIKVNFNELFLEEKIDIINSSFSVLKRNKARLIRFSKLDSICRLLHCQPGDFLTYVPDQDTK